MKTRAAFLMTSLLAMALGAGCTGYAPNAYNAGSLVPAPVFQVRDVTWNAACTTLIDYCVRGKAEVCNVGGVTGSESATCDLLLNGNAVATRATGAVTVAPSDCQVAIADFPEATLENASNYSVQCR